MGSLVLGDDEGVGVVDGELAIFWLPGKYAGLLTSADVDAS